MSENWCAKIAKSHGNFNWEVSHVYVVSVQNCSFLTILMMLIKSHLCTKHVCEMVENVRTAIKILKHFLDGMVEMRRRLPCRCSNLSLSRAEGQHNLHIRINNQREILLANASHSQSYFTLYKLERAIVSTHQRVNKRHSILKSIFEEILCINHLAVTVQPSSPYFIFLHCGMVCVGA